MAAYVMRRVAAFGVTLVLVTAVTFLVLQVIPGDPAQIVLGPDAEPAAVERLRAQLGLDRPAAVQYLAWLGSALRGDLGTSLHYGRPVAELLAGHLPVTLALTALAAALTVALGLPLGLLAAACARRPADTGILAAAQLGLALPSFWLGLLLILLFGLRLRWLPASGFPGWEAGAGAALGALLLPAAALGLARAAVVLRLTRSSLLEALAQDYVRTARAKGLRESAVMFKHAARNALAPVVTALGLQIGLLLAGSIVVEKVFSLPGLGQLTLWAISYRDLPLVQGAVVFIAAAVMVVNLAVDLAYAGLDPRIRYGA
ncbi:MAG: ABC transporter permease [Acetobacteraceae bacterium]|nr:ABC transporter permease [Acetobacteraceae bacterium]